MYHTIKNCEKATLLEMCTTKLADINQFLGSRTFFQLGSHEIQQISHTGFEEESDFYQKAYVNSYKQKQYFHKILEFEPKKEIDFNEIITIFSKVYEDFFKSFEIEDKIIEKLEEFVNTDKKESSHETYSNMYN